MASRKVSGTEFVDIGPAIREGGVALSSKYVRADVYIIDMANKANANEVYSTTRSDMLFAKLASGFSQFIFGSTTAATLRGEIGAISESEAKKAFPTLSNKLSDMAATDDDKKTICRNIGAALSSETQAALSDSGWVALGGGLFIRQIGNIVAIQGTITTVHSGTVFSIPNNIDPPTHSVGYQVATRGSSIAWKVSIASKSRNCVVDYCEDHGKVVEFNLIYMV